MITDYEFSTTVVRSYRRHAAALRRIRRDLDAGLTSGNKATERAAIRHLTATMDLTEHLIETKRRHLAGLLVEEADLHSRVYERKQAGVTHSPDLRERLNKVARDIRLAISDKV